MIRFTVRSVNPLSVYDGEVYTQRILAELNDGAEVHIEDHGCDVDESMVGSEVAATVAGQSVRKITSNQEETMKFESTKGGGVDLYGRVSDIDAETDYPLTVQVAESTVKLDVPDIDEFAVGDWVTIRGATLFVDTIYSDGQNGRTN